MKKLKIYFQHYWANFSLALFLALWFQYVLFGASIMDTEKDFIEQGLAGELSLLIGIFERVLVLFVIGLWFSHGRYIKFFSLPLVTFLGILTPIRLMLGSHLLTMQNLDTVLMTDVSESIGFLSSFSFSSFTISAVLAVLAIFLLLKCNGFADPEVRKRHKQLAALVLVLLPLAFSGSGLWYLCYGFVNSPKESTWVVSGSLPGTQRVENYVIVVGEALRQDALHLYGNEQKTTPFLDSIPTKTVRLVSPSFATAASVPRMLSLTDIDLEKQTSTPQVENNVLALANSAGFQTYWISSQPKTRILNLPISFIAKNADQSIYVDKYNDFAILEEVKKVMSQTRNQGPRFFVLHTYGSHENVCDRVTEDDKIFKTNDELLNCYLGSTLKTDRFLKELSEIFLSRGETYSAIYVSDHGVVLDRTEGKIFSKRIPTKKVQFDVPFVEFGTNVNVSRHFRHQASAMRIADHVPGWLGIVTNITPVDWNLYNEYQETIYVMDGDGAIKTYDSLEISPSINELMGL